MLEDIIGLWSCTSEYKLLTNHFLQLVNKTFTRPVFAVELYDPAEWDFGPVTFQNIVIVRCKSIISPYARSPLYNDGYVDTQIDSHGTEHQLVQQRPRRLLQRSQLHCDWCKGDYKQHRSHLQH